MTGETSHKVDAIAALGIALLVLVLRLPFHPLAILSVDESAYMLVARDLLDGLWPFAGNFDHKPVGIYLHYAAAMALGGEDPSSIRWLTTIAGIASALTLFWMARRVAALPLGTALFAVLAWIFASFGLEGTSANSEMILAPYLLGWMAAFLGFAHGRTRFATSAIVSGALAGIAVQVNYLAGPLLGCLYLAALATGPSERLRWVLASGTVSIFVALLHWLPLELAGTLRNYLHLQAQFLGGYQGEASGKDWAASLPVLATQLLPILAVVAGGLVLARPAKAQRNLVFVGLGASTGGLLAALASMRLFAHYFYLMLPGLFVLALAILAAAPEAKRRLASYALLVAALPGLMIAIGGLKRGYAMPTDAQLAADPGRDRARAIATRFAPAIPVGSSGYVVCEQPVLYLLLGLEDVTDTPFWPLHIYAFMAGAPDEATRIAARRPDFLIIGRSCKPGDEARLRRLFEDYRPLGEAEGAELWQAPQGAA